MNINVTEHLIIELVPSKEAGEPLAILTATGTNDQRIILFLNEVLLLRDVLTNAAVLMEGQETIEKMAIQFVDVTREAMLVEKEGIKGILFLDENEFIPFTDLGYNSKLGFFKKSLFPDVTDESTSSA